MDEQLRKKILALLDQHRVMTLATAGGAGFPEDNEVSGAASFAGLAKGAQWFGWRPRLGL